MLLRPGQFVMVGCEQTSLHFDGADFETFYLQDRKATPLVTQLFVPDNSARPGVDMYIDHNVTLTSGCCSEAATVDVNRLLWLLVVFQRSE